MSDLPETERELILCGSLKRMSLDATKRGDYQLTATLSDALEDRPVVVIAWEGTPGFGLLTISRENGKLHVDTEGMSAKFVAAALDAFKASVLAALDVDTRELGEGRDA